MAIPVETSQFHRRKSRCNSLAFVFCYRVHGDTMYM